jgi:hypothetical protein
MFRVNLTLQQQSIVRVIEEAASTGDAPPTHRELGARFGWSSTATVRSAGRSRRSRRSA